MKIIKKYVDLNNNGKYMSNLCNCSKRQCLEGDVELYINFSVGVGSLNIKLLFQTREE